MPRALITGASSGIGLELARVFARERYDLAIVARSGARLEEIAAELRAQDRVAVDVIVSDLSLPDAPVEVHRQAGRVDALVNNAGYGLYGKFAGFSVADDMNMMHLNMDAVVALTALYLPSMIEARHGRIMNVASTAAFQPGPLMALYYASKAFVLHFSEAIAIELAGTGVTVTALCPGLTASGFQDRAAMRESRLTKLGMMDSRTVAEAGFRGLMAGKTIVIPGMRNKVLPQLVRISPRKMAVAVARKLQDKVH